ncbi:MAG: 30S ribosomal protein S17e [Methanothrix sp.]|jgi:SSU ribosomal protein S17E|uniref:Small ribosomal subunit protein eS17 n=1 Tax=Methanothrix harundinacea TaxID=301375 RepID=A0A101FTB2_9EURY|nr:MAG: 30S ribosomal protein S17e [Methanothrix harundinacea]MDD2638484.1 30S ribosomal protein S17e [Methanothrix sp.]MDI9399858.1 30S ribosomal protein S17e [Euryarchaeota archaeon]KUK97778.1 MAG: 30S ribosomal protein S17e [Methanothrix harundinacea]MCP1392453.1 30S ribosomal protein S17e [Methanothrix harundinacea]
MGSVKPNYIKNFAGDLMKTHQGVFNNDFEHNKDMVTEYTDIKYKSIRNRVAGYITRKVQFRGE